MPNFGGGPENAPRFGGGPENVPRYGTGDANCGCCAPVVVGPVVINDCCCGRDTTQSTAPVSRTAWARAVALNPPANLTSASQIARRAGVPFIMQRQRQTNWCWAAVAEAISNFLDAQTTSALKQELIATSVMPMEHHFGPNGLLDCNKDGLSCNFAAALDDALRVTGNLNQGAGMFNRILTFDSIAKWIDAQLPVGARIVWGGGGAHFIALTGYCRFALEQLVFVCDPDDSDPTYGEIYDYAALVGSYNNAGVWNDTYTVTV